MKQPETAGPEPVTPRMTLLDVMYRWRATEAVFAAYEAQAGVCLRCQALFDTLETTAATYRLDLQALLRDLNALVRNLPLAPG
jgi:hypothetical protein